MSLGVMLFAIRIGRYNARDLLYLAGLLLCAFLLVKSDSSSGLVVALAVILTRLGLDFLSMDRALYKSLLISASITAAGLILAVLANPSEAAALVGRTGTLTGRTTLWAYLMNFVQDRFWNGYGFEAFWSKGSATLEVVQRSVYWAPTHAHNGVLEVLLDLGLIGLILLGTVWAITFIRAVRLALTGNSMEDRWPLMYVIFYTLWIIPEAAALGSAQINFVLLVAVFSCLIIRGPERVRYFADDRLGQYIGLTSVER
ncbi:O-antigen ligase family protein [Thermobaculum terrenum]|nr:O-antigen ligase family protein [Thermobaculum terrenum]